MMRRQYHREKPVMVKMPSFGIFAIDSRHGPGFRMPFERRRFAKLAFVSAGGGALDRVGAPPVPLDEGDFLIVPPGLGHRFRDRPGAPMTLNVVCVDARLCRLTGAAGEVMRALGRRAGRARARTLADAYRRGQVVRRIRSMVFEQTRRAPYFAASLRAQLQDLAVTLLRALGERPAGRPDETGAAARVSSSIVWLAHNFAEPIRIPALARLAGVSTRSYTAHFRRLTGRTVSQHLAGLRADYARE